MNNRESWNSTSLSGKDYNNSDMERTADVYETMRPIFAVVGLVITMVVCMPMIAGSIDEKKEKKKDAGIETVYNGDATYELYTRQDIVYKKGWFGKRVQVISSKTGKPMTVEEFKGEE